LQDTCRDGLLLLKQAGVDIGIMGREEVCCGGRAYELGYESELIKYAEHNMEMFRNAGVETVVTPCADCYHAFKVLYDKAGKHLGIEVLHITEFISRLIKTGQIKFTKSIPMNITYHDPCHLGRLAEPWIHWEGKREKVLGQMIIHNPPKQYRRGTYGIYEIPRDILHSIPGLKLTEMYRIREYAWCCGSGGGVKEAYPDFAIWTANDRIREAKAVGAEAIVSACPWCESNFMDAIDETGEKLKVFNIIELVRKAL
jgi:Fe-S oxidoreductase